MPNSQTINIATRKSPLALWQANYVRAQLLHYWPTLNINLLPLETTGDRFLTDKLLTIGNKGLFLKELEEALLDKRADIAVHSMKDMPAAIPPELTLAAISKREAPWDAFLSNKYVNLSSLPKNASVGTASLRRTSQLLALRPDLQIVSLRGNINTRIQKMSTENLDAIILAAAGLRRLAYDNLIKETFGPEIMLPACGQGALGIECRTQDENIQNIITKLNDPSSALCVHTERTVNEGLGGHCHTPVAIFCEEVGSNTLLLRARVLSLDGKIMLKYHQEGAMNAAPQLAADCIYSLLASGAADLLSANV